MKTTHIAFALFALLAGGCATAPSPWQWKHATRDTAPPPSAPTAQHALVFVYHDGSATSQLVKIRSGLHDFAVLPVNTFSYFQLPSGKQSLSLAVVYNHRAASLETIDPSARFAGGAHAVRWQRGIDTEPDEWPLPPILSYGVPIAIPIGYSFHRYTTANPQPSSGPVSTASYGATFDVQIGHVYHFLIVKKPRNGIWPESFDVKPISDEAATRLRYRLMQVKTIL